LRAGFARNAHILEVRSASCAQATRNLLEFVLFVVTPMEVPPA